MVRAIAPVGLREIYGVIAGCDGMNRGHTSYNYQSTGVAKKSVLNTIVLMGEQRKWCFHVGAALAKDWNRLVTVWI